MTGTAAVAGRVGSARPMPLGRRSRALLAVTSVVGLAAFAWPFLVSASAAPDMAHAADAPWIFVALLPLLFALVLAELADGSMDAKSVAMLGVLAACGAALRLPGGVVAFEPVFFLLLPAGRALGRGFGFVLGALTIFVSALVTGGVGPWLPFQMLGAAWVGFGAGCLPRTATAKRELAVLAGYGFVAGFAFGALMNLWFWPFVASDGDAVAFSPGAGFVPNLGRYAAFYVTTSLAWDLTRAVTNAALVLLAGRPVLAALRRAARKAAFGAPVTFVPPARTPAPTPARARPTDGSFGVPLE